MARIDALSTVASQSIRAERLGAAVASAAGALGLALVAVGLFGIVAYATARRAREFGVRAALGAQRSTIVRMVICESLDSVMFGLGAGAFIAWAGARMFSAHLFGVPPGDLLSFAAAAGLVLVVAVGASLVPAFRATRIDPVAALRQE